jgi:hypothetical protein
MGQIIISQVYNGVSNNKCIEITNIGDDLDLAFPVQYKVGLWANAGTTGVASISGNPTGFLNLSGTLTQGQKCVISNSGSTVPINGFNALLISNNAVTTFDGNDGLAIFTGTNTLVDAFGIGINYNSISYERQEQVVSPKADFRIPEWISKTLAQFDAAGGQDNTILGLHYFDACYFIITNMLGSLNTTYGTSSLANSFVVAYKSFRYPRNPMVPPGITPTNLTVPSGFEISSVSNFTSNVYAGGTTFEPVDDGSGLPITYYLRLAGTSPPGNYSGSIFISKFNPYEDVYVPTDAINTVNAKQISISGLVANNKVNDGTTFATLRGNAVLSGVLTADVSNVILGGTPVANFNNAQTGNNKPVIVSGYSISGSKSGNYALNQPTGLTANITDVDVPLVAQTITFNNLARATYGGANFNLTATASSGLAVSYTSSNPNVAIVIGNTVTIIGIGTTTITALQDGDSVYGVASAVNQPLTVNPKPITVTATAAGKIYDSSNVAIVSGTLIGVINSDVVTFIGSGTFVSINAGTGIAVTSTSTLGGAHASKYILTQPTGLTATIIVKPITVVATATNKIYDRTTSASITGTLVGVLGADIVTFNGIGTFASVNAGTGIVVTSASTLTGANSANYSLTQPTGLSATITKKALTIAGAVAANKSFDGTTVATITGTLSGIIAPDVVTLVATGTFASSAIGNGIAVTSTSTLTGAAAANYSLTQPVGLTANITGPTVLTVGDLSIIGFQFTVSNSFAFVCWVDISTNTYIKFTDNAFLSSGSATATNNARGGENFVIWRNNGPTISAGTIITIRDVNTAASSNRGIIVSGNLNGLSLSGDTIFAYQGAATSGTTPDWNANTNPTTFTGTVLFGLYGQGTSSFTTWITSGGASSNNSYLPSQLNVTNGNIALASLASRGQYTGSRSNQTSFNSYRALVTNPSNWTTAPGAGTITLNTTGFTLPPASTAAVISGNASICLGASSNLKVDITGGTSPFKIVYSDGNTSFTVNNYVSGTNISISPTISTNYSLVSVTDSNNFAGTGNVGTAIITVSPLTTVGSESVSVCGTAYTWALNGQTYITSGVYPFVSGCNTATLNLTITPLTTTGSESVTACGASYVWATSGATYSASGVYPFVAGCNTATLSLTLNTPQTFYADTDGDGFGAGAAISSCTGQPIGTSTNNTDCAPADASVWQVATFFVDSDADGYTNGTAAVCSGAGAPTGYSASSSGMDCDDNAYSLTNQCGGGLVVNLTMFIEGYYAGGNTMNTARLNQDSVSPSDEVEVMTVNLHDATTYDLVDTAIGTLKTDGALSVTFTTAVAGSYYVAVKGVNAIETWTATPQMVGSTPLSYDFSSSASQAYEEHMREMEPGVFAFYQGDINQDGAMDNSDFDQLFPDIDNSNFGVLATDLNGDGAVDNSDLDNIFGNVDNSIYAHRPY